SAAQKLGKITYAKGFSGREDVYDDALAAEAIEAAKKADKVVVFAGLPDSFESEGYDRVHMNLPACQNRLIAELAVVNPNLVVVLHNGAPVTLPWLDKVPALLEAYLGGQAGGEAVANILYGVVNPSGKLAETFPVKLSDNPSYLNFGGKETVEYREGVFVGYRYYDKKEMAVNFPFGHGLSYTTFAYSNLKLSGANMAEGETLSVSVDVTNTGAVAGKETVQLYVGDRTGKVQRPIRELKGFAKIALAPGETGTVTMTLNNRAFSWYSTELHDWYAFPGEYEIAVGASSRDIRLTETVRYQTDRTLPLRIGSNSTIGDLLENGKTKAFGEKLVGLMNAHFNADQSSSDAAADAMNDEMMLAMAEAQPLRSLVSFGIMTPEELQSEITKYTD
ncbi:MAG: glycoside hydrolase family 3 C-terminal domain-containing protein, partial [Oscillospiraceae bacterium]|nr:glycoside hydrolase family 3 C-terminal domain-containing protein [Oscillospiraceae bacterium]